MEKMPKSFEKKLRRFNKLINESMKLDSEIQEILEENKIPYDNLVATADPYSKEPITESLAYINNGECEDEISLNEAIEEIREVYEYFLNK